MSTININFPSQNDICLTHFKAFPLLELLLPLRAHQRLNGKVQLNLYTQVLSNNNFRVGPLTYVNRQSTELGYFGFITNRSSCLSQMIQYYLDGIIECQVESGGAQKSKMIKVCSNFTNHYINIIHDIVNDLICTQYII